ncbi:hypothetical protein SAMN05661096_00785 [Marivirga sericea]|uniref:Uncharacterized protein n=1 Tax=Marivirga sericea TaxID=1028 RepID=A0A1X7ILU4_9BACT|nr:hypothetical protein [Marivirga sericea]SMG15560.1 hypothetical protein SAMN05661096_00785 [Marivirga sericea]
MNKIIYISVWLFSFIFVVGFFFKILSLPYATILLYLGGTVSGLICYPILFVYRWRLHKLTENRMLFQWIFGQGAIAILVISTWLRFINHFSANVTLVIAFSIFAFAFLPLLFFNMYKQSLKET